MLFVGSFGHPPNIDAAIRLARGIFPGVRARVPEATLEIVGDAPPQAVRRLAGEGIVVTGRVADVRPHLDNAAVVAAPLRLGGGMRVKVLESLAAGKAMVATPRAVAGLGLEPGTHALIAESDGELSDALVSLLGDPELRRRMGRAARSLAAEQPQLGARDGGVRRALRVPARRAGRRRRMTRPRVAFVGWRLGGELERVIALGHERFDYTVVSMDLDEALRPLVEWRRMPKPMFGSFRLGWVAFFAVGGLRLARIDADLVHAVGPVPVVPNGVDLNTVTLCHASYDEATAGHPVKASSSWIGWKLGQRFTLALERWWFRRAVRVLLGLSEGSAADLRRFYPSTRVAVMPRGIDLQRFKPDDEDRRRFREEQGVPPAAVVAVFVDQQHRPHKGLEVAIEAFAGAARSGAGPDLLWVVGAGNEASRGSRRSARSRRARALPRPHVRGRALLPGGGSVRAAHASTRRYAVRPTRPQRAGCPWWPRPCTGSGARRGRRSGHHRGPQPGRLRARAGGSVERSRAPGPHGRDRAQARAAVRGAGGCRAHHRAARIAARLGPLAEVCLSDLFEGSIGNGPAVREPQRPAAERGEQRVIVSGRHHDATRVQGPGGVGGHDLAELVVERLVDLVENEDVGLDVVGHAEAKPRLHPLRVAQHRAARKHPRAVWSA